MARWNCPIEDCEAHTGDGIDGRGRMGHMRKHEIRDQSIAVLDLPPVPPETSRRRYRRGVDNAILKPIQQIRRAPQVITGAGGYYLDPEGATIRDALHYYPNGAGPDEIDAKYTVDYDRHRLRQAQKGFEWLGVTLNAPAVRKLVKTIQSNRKDEIKQTEYEINVCEHTIRHSVDNRQRAIAQRRYEQWKKRLELLELELDPDALIAELDGIAKAQRMAKLPPEMRALIGEMLDERQAAIVAQLTTRERGVDRELGVEPAKDPVHNANWSGTTEFTDGKDFIDASDD